MLQSSAVEKYHKGGTNESRFSWKMKGIIAVGQTVFKKTKKPSVQYRHTVRTKLRVRREE